MSTRRFDYLRDLSRHGCALVVKCRQCDHSADFHPLDLIGRFPSNTSLANIAGRLKCSKCGGKRFDWWPQNR